MPRSPVHSDRKFSAVFGTTVFANVMTMRPTNVPFTAMSKNTLGHSGW
jgi:hypothetical protein